MLYKFLACQIAFWLGAHAVAATIYLEDFEGQTGKGVYGPGGSSPNVNLTGVDWTVDTSGTNMTGDSNGDYFWVINPSGSNEVLGVKDPGGYTAWVSPVIDITGYTDVSVSVYMASINSNYDENIHEVQFFYSIDGGTAVEFFNADDYWGPTASENDLIPTGTFSSGVIATGSTLQVTVAVDSNSGAGAFEFDDITVTGVPEPASVALLLLGFGLCVSRGRLV